MFCTLYSGNYYMPEGVRSSVPYPTGKILTLERKMSDQISSRKYSRKGIKSAPKTLRQFRSSVNKLLWRKYHLVRADVGCDDNTLASAFNNGVDALAVVETLVRGS